MSETVSELPSAVGSMLDISSMIYAIVAMVVLTYMYFFIVRNLDLPPGPFKFPILGNLWWVLYQRVKGKRTAATMKEAWQKYGKVVHLTFFNTNIVFLNETDTIQEAFVKQSENFSDRPHWMVSKVRPGKGVIFQNGHNWKTMRRFTLVALKGFGVGKTSLEDKILQEVEAATDVFMQNKEQPTEYRHLTSKMIINVIYGIVFGTRLEYNSHALEETIEKMDVLFGNTSSIDGPATAVPRIFWKLVGNKERYNAVQIQQASFAWIRSQIDKHIEEHRDSLDVDNPRDFIDLFLAKEVEETDKTSFPRESLYEVIIDLFIAGSETTSNSLNWCILYMQEYPEVQKRCQKEIYEKYGNRQISYADRGTLPYTEATLLEIQRMSNIAESSLPHTNLKETTFQGYRIPANSLIFGHLYSSNMDPKYWNDPQTFNPERHLKNGQLVKNPAFMPFSVGPRMCLGDMLAKMELFLIVTNLLQRFRFERGQPGLKHSFECLASQLTAAPTPYTTKVIKRET